MNANTHCFMPHLITTSDFVKEPLAAISDLLDALERREPANKLEEECTLLIDAIIEKCQGQEREMLAARFPKDAYAEHVADHSNLVRGVIDLKAKGFPKDHPTHPAAARFVNEFRELYLHHASTFGPVFTQFQEDTGAA